jgi:predicted HAD superfamily Cof-like phosphohydrolase
MKQEQEQVRQFMVKAGQDTPDHIKIPQASVLDLRDKLIEEELQEFKEAQTMAHSLGQPEDIAQVADAIGDLLVVVLGAAVAWGIDIQSVWDEIHRSNMSKFIDGYKREDGKWMKGPSYSPANITPIIVAQLDKKGE